MSVLIRGMEMPKRGDTITITICGDGLVFEEYKEPGRVFNAVPVPTPHGDLIERDGLYRKAFDLESSALEVVKKTEGHEWDKWSAILCERTAFKHDIMYATTIIPAEEEQK